MDIFKHNIILTDAYRLVIFFVSTAAHFYTGMRFSVFHVAGQLGKESGKINPGILTKQRGANEYDTVHAGCQCRLTQRLVRCS